MPDANAFRYRPEVDGLRAVAVVAVVLFHARLGFPGGFVGVDVFFVISGFLITSLIWKDLECGRFSFSQFWERRARRILPALTVVTVATLAAGWLFLFPPDFKDLGQATIAQTVFAANVHYLWGTGYFGKDADLKPLLHTWSLAVEEQFYLMVPVLLGALYRVQALRKRNVVILLIVAGAVLSCALSAYFVIHKQPVAFYSLPTRAWELLAGALLAFLPDSPKQLESKPVRDTLAALGLVLILLPMLFYGSRTPFPGLAALPPCLGTALVIWANGPGHTAIGALLSLRPVVFVGLISYSLYLWHWPLLAISRNLIFPLPFSWRAGLMALSFALAVLSWKYVEAPFRERRIGSSRKSMYAWSGASLVTVFAFGLWCQATNGFPQRFPAQASKFAKAVDDAAFIKSTTTEEVLARKITSIGTPNRASKPMVLAWGDSHVMAALPAIDALLKEKGLRGEAATLSTTAPVLDWFPKGTWMNGKVEKRSFNEAVFSYIQSERIPNVILGARWSAYAEDAAVSRRFNVCLLQTIRRLVAAGSRPWVLLDVPQPRYDVPKALARAVIAGRDVNGLNGNPPLPNELGGENKAVLAQIRALGGRILDPKPTFLDASKRHYVVQMNGTALYRDNSHLTVSGANLTLLPFLRESLKLEKGAVERPIVR